MTTEEEITPLETENPMVPGGDLDPELKEALKDALSDMKGPVEALVFVKDNCYYCNETKKLLNHFVEASPEVDGKKLFSFKVIDIAKMPEEAQKYNIKRAPTVAFIDGYIKYIGIPSGEEIRSLVETIIRLSENESGLEQESKEKLKHLKKDVTIEVIITPSCPYCPYAALMANMVAFEAYKLGGNKVFAHTVEAYENPDIADRYNVMSVPAIAINGTVQFVGLPYEQDFVNKILGTE